MSRNLQNPTQNRVSVLEMGKMPDGGVAMQVLPFQLPRGLCHTDFWQEAMRAGIHHAPGEHQALSFRHLHAHHA